LSDVPFQTEIAVSLPASERTHSTINLSPTGDIRLITGRDKLVTQMLRAIVSEGVFTDGVINSSSDNMRNIRAMMVNVFRKFRSNQINYVQENDPDLTGFAIYRKAAGSDDAYVKVSGNGVTNKFVDTGLENGKTYSYATTRFYKDVFETQFVDTVDITPSAFSKNLTVISKSAACFISGNGQVEIYVDFRKRFKASELLNKILETQVIQDSAEPRKYSVQIKVEDVRGSLVSVSSVRRGRNDG